MKLTNRLHSRMSFNNRTCSCFGAKGRTDSWLLVCELIKCFIWYFSQTECKWLLQKEKVYKIILRLNSTINYLIILICNEKKFTYFSTKFTAVSWWESLEWHFSFQWLRCVPHPQIATDSSLVRVIFVFHMILQPWIQTYT